MGRGGRNVPLFALMSYADGPKPNRVKGQHRGPYLVVKSFLFFFIFCLKYFFLQKNLFKNCKTILPHPIEAVESR